jgi:Flp pilus assembly CpaF family ATPase
MMGKTKNILIAGDTGSGNCTVIKLPVNQPHQDQRLFLIEDIREIRIPNPDRNPKLFREAK